MVATRRGTRVEPQDEGDRSAAEQTPEEVISPTSPMQTRRSVRKDGQADEKSADEGKSMVTNRSPLKSETVKHSIQISTRSRHRSGQSDADVSEAESTTSNASTRRSSSRQSIGQLTDSTRKLRSLRSALITEPIIESKEDAELSEAESNCSSVSTTARRKLPGTASRSVSTRSRRSLLISEPTSDVSDAESNSSVLGVKTIVTRSTRSSSRRSLSLVSEPQKEQTSDAESCSSGFSLQPLARRSSRRNKSNLQSDEVTFVSETNEDDALDQKSPKKHDVKSDAPSSLGEHSVISSPRRSSRNQPAIQEDEVIIVSDDECESSNTKNQVLVIDQQEVEESSLAKEADLPVETSAMSSLQSSKTQPEVINLPDQMLGLSDDSVNEEPATEKSHMTNDDGDATEETIENIQDMPEDTNMADSIRLVIDSDDSEKSEHSDDDDDDDEEDENNMEVEEEDHDQVVEKRKSQKTSKQQLQNVAGDGLFVIDTAPGVDSSKKYFLEPEDSDDDKEDENETREKGEIPEPDIDDDDDDFIDKDEDEDEEEALLNRPKSGFALSTSIDTGISLKEMGGLYISFDSEKPNAGPGLLSKMKKGNQKKDELLQKSVITPDFEKKECVPPYTESKNKLKKKRQEEREKTTGRGWFDMKAPELTDELKNDLKALKMRSAMDPKHFYKKNDREGFPKYFQVGTVVDSPVDFYHSRIPKKQRKRTIVEELLADSEFRRYNKKKFKEIIAEKAARAEGKKNRKKKKFRT